MESDTGNSGSAADNWGRWGKDDERGALNLLSDPSIVRRGADAIRTGKFYNLGLPVQREGVPLGAAYRPPPQRLTLLNHTDEPRFQEMSGRPGLGANGDMLIMLSHCVTHMDALCHIYADGAIYNGHSHEGMSSYSGAEHCGIEKAGGFATRGLLIDVAAHHEVEWLDAGHVITVEDVEGALGRQGCEEPRPGDVVLFRTGWVEWFMANDFEMSSHQPGIGMDVARYLAERDVVAVGADNSAVEVQPFDGDFLCVHIEMLVKRGIFLIEHLALAELSKDACHEFLFVVAPLLITGATASPVNPIAVG